MTPYKDIFYSVEDGLQLHARDYDSASADSSPENCDKITVLCLHGLSRNAADFEPLVQELSGDYRLLVTEQRGRGQSQWDAQHQRYHLLTYVQDMWQLLDHLGIEKVVIVGTSMGGLMGMIMVNQQPQRIAGLVINDVGPEVHPEGIGRIMSYLGKKEPVKTWQDAVSQTRDMNEVCFPSYNDEQWLAMTRRLFRENDQGVPVLDYDPMISAPLTEDQKAAAPSDPWALFRGLKGTPLLVLRGELSDLLSRDCFLRMQSELPELTAVEVPAVGHAPALDEAAAVSAIEQFLQRADIKQAFIQSRVVYDEQSSQL
ncbi:alpha/beta hydrolase [Aestuariicella sp. G3-2]|uniref:alpha/beta fold hydrolase n=1 Tax=Pseudomaricurvus albidus TaxID=2842452 RepID=UPI001C0B1D42|nr:alpha/beta hydrolase [Aestuariicella albida]MBU3069761.1 alpha/beta hydrolase [Aestuariicella albida]